MTIETKIKSCVNFEPNLEKSYEWFHLKTYQSDNLTKRLRTKDYLKPRPNKNEHECKKCGCNYFYVSNCQSFSFKFFKKYKSSASFQLKWNFAWTTVLL